MNIRQHPYLAEIAPVGPSTKITTPYYRWTVSRDESGKFLPSTAEALVQGDSPTLEEARQKAEDTISAFIRRDRGKIAA